MGKLIKISEKNLIVIPSAFSDKIIYSDEMSEEKWIMNSVSDSFGEECDLLLKNIIQEAEYRRNTDKLSTSFSITTWNYFAQTIWETIENYRGLHELNNITELRQRDILIKKVTDLIKETFEDDQKLKFFENKIAEYINTNCNTFFVENEFGKIFDDEVKLIREKWMSFVNEFSRLEETIKKQSNTWLEYQINSKRETFNSNINTRILQIQLSNDLAFGNKKIKESLRNYQKNNRI